MCLLAPPARLASCFPAPCSHPRQPDHAHHTTANSAPPTRPPICSAAIGDDQYNPKYELDGYQEILAKWTVPASAIIGFVFMVNRQRYWRHYEFWNTALFTLPIVMLPAIRCSVV